MSDYRYRAARSDGAMTRGVISAHSMGEAAGLLSERGLYPVEITPSVSLIRPAPIRDLSLAFRSLASLTEAGVPLDKGLDATINLARPGLRKLLAETRMRLREGLSLSQAMALPGSPVPQGIIGLLRAGERSGRIAETLSEIAGDLDGEIESRDRLRQALAYPCLIAVVGSLAAIVMIRFVVPRFASLLGDMGADIPRSTRALLTVSEISTRHWLVFALMILGAGVMLLESRRRPKGKEAWDRLMLALPVLGPIRFQLASGRFCRALAGALDAGLPLPPALEAASSAAGDMEIQARAARAQELIANGASLQGSLYTERVLSRTALDVLGVGEASGKVSLMARRAADMASKQGETALRSAVGFLEPAMIIVFGGLIALVAIGLLQAMYGLRVAG